MKDPFKDSGKPLASSELEVLRQLFFHGPTWDGNLASKTGRDGLVERGLALRRDGWQTLSEVGFIAAVEAGYGDRKETWEHQRRGKQA